MQRSLAASAIDCAQLLDKLATLLHFKPCVERSSLHQTDVEDQSARFRVWAGNLGAFQSLPAASSLDYRLRESPKIATQIQELLEDIRETTDNIHQIAVGELPNRRAESENDSSAETEETSNKASDENVTSLCDDGETRISDDNNPEQGLALSEAEELFESVKDTIGSLFRLAVIIRSATPRDRYARALSGRNPFDETFDIAHVSHKYPKLDDRASEWLKQRLGKAVTQRRQFLRYAREHRHKLGKESGDLWQPSPAVLKKTNEDVRHPIGWSGASRAAKTDISKPLSTLAPTTASTLFLPNTTIEEQEFRDDVSQTSYARSFGEASEGDNAQLPSLSDISKGQNTFECPFCWTMQTFHKEHSWRKHALSDLRPYVCTFGNCDVKLFANRQDWFDHEMERHRAQWHCHFCSREKFQSLDVFREHLRVQHTQEVTEDQLDALIAASRRPCDQFEASECPFCDEWEFTLRESNPEILTHETIVVTAAQFRHHVGLHMYDLTLFAIPRGYLEPDEADTNSVASVQAAGGNKGGLSRADSESLQSEATEVEQYQQTMPDASTEQAEKERDDKSKQLLDLQGLHIFQKYPQFFEDIKQVVVFIKCREGAVIIPKDSVSTWAGWLVRGETTLSHAVLLTPFYDNTFFGFDGVLLGAPSQFQINAITDCLVARVDWNNMLRILSIHPEAESDIKNARLIDTSVAGSEHVSATSSPMPGESKPEASTLLDTADALLSSKSTLDSELSYGATEAQLTTTMYEDQGVGQVPGETGEHIQPRIASELRGRDDHKQLAASTDQLSIDEPVSFDASMVKTTTEPQENIPFAVSEFRTALVGAYRKPSPTSSKTVTDMLERFTHRFHSAWFLNSHLSLVDGQRPLHLAIRSRYMQLVEQLLRHGADPDLDTKKGTTSIDIAIGSTNEVEIVDVLIKHGATRVSPDLVPQLHQIQGRLHIKHEYQCDWFSLFDPQLQSSIPVHLSMISEILKTSPNVTTTVYLTDQSGRTALDIAVSSYVPELIQVLLENGASASPGSKISPFEQACNNRHPRTIQVFLDYGYDESMIRDAERREKFITWRDEMIALGEWNGGVADIMSESESVKNTGGSDRAAIDRGDDLPSIAPREKARLGSTREKSPQTSKIGSPDRTIQTEFGISSTEPT